MRKTKRSVPAAVQPGDTIGIVSPSWFGGEAFLPRAQRGIARLQRLGFQVIVAEHAFNNVGHVSDSPRNRAADLNAMFADPDVSMILATIGGDHSCQLLPHIDWDLVRENPKVFMGFSDMTVLNLAFHTATGLITFNGPSLLTDWAEYPTMPEFSRRQALNAISRAEPLGDLAPAPWWTDEFLDWSTGADLVRPRQQTPSEGWVWLREGWAEGPLLGGCIESLNHLRGTPWWPEWDDTILFIEMSEEKPSPAEIDGMLMDYENMGVLQQLQGMVVARPYGYTPEETHHLHAVVVQRTSEFGFPVLANTDLGHTTPLQTVPIGCTAVLDSARNRFAITEAAVS